MTRKKNIKLQVINEKGNFCTISKQKLPSEFKLFDTHRKVPKKENGTYSSENTEVIDPVEHMKIHDNYRERDQKITELKSMIDNRRQILKLKSSMENRLDSDKRKTDVLDKRTKDFLKSELKVTEQELGKRDREIKKFIKTIDDPLIKAALSVKAVGEITVAHCIVYIDLAGVYPDFYIDKKTGKKKPHPKAGKEKARHPSGVWAYCGLDKSSLDRYQKGVKGGGNKTLRTALYTMAESQIRHNGPYAYLLYQEFIPAFYRLSDEEISKMTDGKYKETIVKAREKRPWLIGRYGRKDLSNETVRTRTTNNEIVVVPWKDTKPSHRRGTGIRKMMKHFLADYWYVGRTLMGLPTEPMYPEVKCSGDHRIVMPEERGWIY